MISIKHFAYRRLNSVKGEELLESLFGSYSILTSDWLRQKYWTFLSGKLSPEELFRLIYSKNLWNNDESVSGPGSTVAATSIIRNGLSSLLKDLKIKSFLDIPCGDFNWMQHVNLHNIRYIGADIVFELIERNQKLHGGKNREFVQLNIIKDKLPGTDIVFCRDCLVHLSNKNILKAISNIKNCGATYLLTTHFPDCLKNREIDTNYWRPLNLEKKPFNLPPPVLMIDEGNQELGHTDKSLGLWKIKYL